MEVENYATKGIAGTGLGLGIAGTALGILNGGLGLLNGAPLGGAYTPVLAEKDQEIAMLKAENYTNSKISDLEKVVLRKCYKTEAKSIVFLSYFYYQASKNALFTGVF